MFHPLATADAAPVVMTGSAGEWAATLGALFSYALICAVLGTAVGFYWRGRGVPRLLAAGAVSFAFFILAVAIGLPAAGAWARQHPFVSALHCVGPYLMFFFAPSAVASLLAGPWADRRYPRGRTNI